MFNKHQPKQPPKASDPHYNVHDQIQLIETVVWARVVTIVTIILAGIVAFMLYSLAYVTQPIKSMAPMDQAFAKMLNDIVLLIVGGIGGVMSRKGVQALAERAATAQVPPPQQVAAAPSASPAPAASGAMFDFNFGGFKNPELDETWRPGPPPTTPPDYLDPSREEIAQERATVKDTA